MHRIGDFSRLTQVPVKTLRYYDEMGLLAPGYVDKDTGYRYYSAEQMPRLNRVLALRDLGFSLEQIRHMLDATLPVSEIRGMLRLRQAEAQQKLWEEQQQLARIDARIRQIEQEGDMSKYDVVLKRVEPVTVAALHEVIPSYPHVGGLFERVCGTLMRNGAKLGAPGIALYYDTEYKESDVDVEAAMPFSGAFTGDGSICLRELPPVECVASTVHHGPYSQLIEAYGALMQWIEQNGYRICGPCREVYIRCSDSGSTDDANCVTEVQAPVEKLQR